MATETFRLGRKAVAYYNATAVPGTTRYGYLIGEKNPSDSTLDAKTKTWLSDTGTVAAGNMTSVTLNISSEYADGTTRETAEDGFASQIPVLRNGEVSFEARWRPDDPADLSSFTKLLMTAWETDTPIAMAFLDQPYTIPASGSVVPQGLAANFLVSINKTEDLRDVQRLSVSLTISDSATWYSETLSAS